MTTCELEFLTQVCKKHMKYLPEDTAILLLEYFHGVYTSRPYLTNAMKLINHVGNIVKRNKETSMGVLRYVE